MRRVGHVVGHRTGSMSHVWIFSSSSKASLPSLRLPYTGLPPMDCFIVRRALLKRVKADKDPNSHLNSDAVVRPFATTRDG